MLFVSLCEHILIHFCYAQETWLLSKERELKEHVRKDRDKEIEMVITRLEDDAQSAREELERATENRIKLVVINIIQILTGTVMKYHVFKRVIFSQGKWAALRENIVPTENITISAPPTRDISNVPVDICYIRWSKFNDFIKIFCAL